LLLHGRESVSSEHLITVLLEKTSRGDENARSELFRLIYGELQSQAERFLRRQAPHHSLDPSALVHEVYLKMLDQQARGFKNRGHFFASAASAMRWILVDHARAKKRKKRKAPGREVPLSAISVHVGQQLVDVLDLDAALTKLAEVDPQAARIVELRHFAGLSINEVASEMGLAVRTTEREWRFARAWLRGAME